MDTPAHDEAEEMRQRWLRPSVFRGCREPAVLLGGMRPHCPEGEQVALMGEAQAGVEAEAEQGVENHPRLHKVLLRKLDELHRHHATS
jgi:hypothetical protein